MVSIVAPVFLIVMVGYVFGRTNAVSADAEKLLNTYVLYVALPALLFLPVAQADSADLLRADFVLATLLGIVVAYLLGVLVARYRGVAGASSSLVGMGASYGTTGYMGIPILISAYGQDTAVPAAVATILHNVPVIMAVIISHEIGNAKGSGGISKSVSVALLTTLRNPLTLAVLAGAVISLLGLSLPGMLRSFASLLGNAAGPTALFALGLGLARIKPSAEFLRETSSWLAPVAGIKLFVQPAITALALMLMSSGSLDVWAATAIVMAAQPVGAGVYVFASRYGFFARESSMAILISLLLGVCTVTALLELMSDVMK